MNRAEVFDQYGVCPFESSTRWSVTPREGLGVCHGELEDCGELATHIVQWQGMTMSAPAFLRFCPQHAARYIAWRAVLDEEEGPRR